MISIFAYDDLELYSASDCTCKTDIFCCLIDYNNILSPTRGANSFDYFFVLGSSEQLLVYENQPSSLSILFHQRDLQVISV